VGLLPRKKTGAEVDAGAEREHHRAMAVLRDKDEAVDSLIGEAEGLVSQLKEQVEGAVARLRAATEDATDA
jgi:hypothetical protein